MALLIRCTIAYLVAFFILVPSVNAQLFHDRNLENQNSRNDKQNLVPSFNSTESDEGPKNTGTQASSSYGKNASGYGPGVQTIRIHVLGNVINPGVYTIGLSDRLGFVLETAQIKRKSQRLIQVRHPQKKTKYYDLYRYYHEGDLNHNPYLEDNDVVFVPQHNGVIRIEGPVSRPGTYELYYEKNLMQIIGLAGGLTTAASQIDPIKVVRFSEGGKKFILDVSNSQSDLKNFKIAKGDIIIVPDIINNPKNFDYKVETIPGENHFYPTATPNVFVAGQVTQPGPFPYKSHLQVRDYVANAGPTQTANMRYVTLVRNGKRTRVSFDNKLHAGDIIMVKGKINYGLIVGSLSTVLSLTLTSLLVENTIRGR